MLLPLTFKPAMSLSQLGYRGPTFSKWLAKSTSSGLICMSAPSSSPDTNFNGELAMCLQPCSWGGDPNAGMVKIHPGPFPSSILTLQLSFMVWQAQPWILEVALMYLPQFAYTLRALFPSGIYTSPWASSSAQPQPSECWATLPYLTVVFHLLSIKTDLPMRPLCPCPSFPSNQDPPWMHHPLSLEPSSKPNVSSPPQSITPLLY